MVKLSSALQKLKPFKALCIGDFLRDVYTLGKVRRISPEAPVPVMEALSQESRPGGAGNVVLNLAVLGGTVVPVGRVGADADGEVLNRELGTSAKLLPEANYKTPVKNRLIADSQQLMRIDFETIQPLSNALESEVLATLREAIASVDVVAISDYGKGFVTPRILERACALARELGIPLIVDPKGTEFAKYRGATMLKPNLGEAIAAAKLAPGASLDDVAAALLKLTDVDQLLITRSEAGISCFEQSGRRDFPVHARQVKDVTGAGDTVLAVLAAGVANKLDLGAAIQLANIAAGLCVERVGCAQITLSEIAQRLIELDAHPKIFHKEHLEALVQALQERQYNLLVLNEPKEMTNALYRTIREIAAKSQSELMVQLKGKRPSEEFLGVLSSLDEVDFILPDAESVERFCPREIFEVGKNSQPQKG